MKNVQRTRAEHLVEDGRVAQGRTEDGFEDQTKVHEVATHALFEDGQLAALAIIKSAHWTMIIVMKYAV